MLKHRILRCAENDGRACALLLPQSQKTLIRRLIRAVQIRLQYIGGLLRLNRKFILTQSIFMQLVKYTANIGSAQACLSENFFGIQYFIYIAVGGYPAVVHDDETAAKLGQLVKAVRNHN